MGLPANIEDLINSRTVESSRKEFKKGWNPEEIIRTICAFANDINELGGGYILIGIEEKDGSPVLPPHGLQQNQLDAYQMQFLQLCHKLKPKIFPIIEPIELQDKFILVIWVTTGEERPYDCPSTFGAKAQRKIYVRPTSATIPVTPELEKRLRGLATFKHFDDRVNTRASINDLDLGLILSYLQETKAQLFDKAAEMQFEDLCLKMGIVRGPKENIRPLNVGLLLFCKRPETFFEGCRTNLIEFENEAGTEFSSKSFTGPVHIQIRQIMEHFETNILREFGQKRNDRVEANVFVNYPYKTLRESVVNAFYHRNYENATPNEIRVYKKGNDRRIEILSYDGPLPPIDEQSLVQLKISAARNYRNIKLGDWLKQIHLAEKFATGIPTMVNELDKNGSPKPLLSMDENRSYFTVVIKIHPDTPDETLVQLPRMEAVQLTNNQQQILESIETEPLQENELISLYGSDVLKELAFLLEKSFVGMKLIERKKYFFFNDSRRLYFLTKQGTEALKQSF